MSASVLASAEGAIAELAFVFLLGANRGLADRRGGAGGEKGGSCGRHLEAFETSSGGE